TLKSRWFRAGEAGLLGNHAPDPARLDAGQRAVWYAAAWRAAGGDAAPPAWVVYRGHADPRPEGFRLVTEPGGEALLVAREDAALDFDVTPLDVGGGEIRLVYGFRGDRDFFVVSLFRGGGVRLSRVADGRWEHEPTHPAPPLAPDAACRVALRDGVVRVGDAAVLHVRPAEGRAGIGLHDAAADFDGGPRRRFR
ncbi:MAG: hypothetical protein ACREID_03495, partial [Planctomycetota bacterium]